MIFGWKTYFSNRLSRKHSQSFYFLIGYRFQWHFSNHDNFYLFPGTVRFFAFGLSCFLVEWACDHLQYCSAIKWLLRLHFSIVFPFIRFLNGAKLSMLSIICTAGIEKERDSYLCVCFFILCSQILSNNKLFAICIFNTETKLNKSI